MAEKISTFDKNYVHRSKKPNGTPSIGNPKKATCKELYKELFNTGGKEKISESEQKRHTTFKDMKVGNTIVLHCFVRNTKCKRRQ